MDWYLMRRVTLTLLMIIVIGSLISGCTSSVNQSILKSDTNNLDQKINVEEKKRVDLYIAVMKEAFQEENGGNSFIAVKFDTLEGLSDVAKSEVLKGLNDLSPNRYNFDEIKEDNTKFMFDDQGRLDGTLDGSLLWIEIKEYSGNKAKITGVCWFGSTGAVFPDYEATYKNGVWKLKLVGMAVS